LGVYDQAGRYLIKRQPSAFFTWRAPSLWRTWKFVRWQDTRTLPFPGEPDRVCDTVAEFENPKDSKRLCLVVTACVGRGHGPRRVRSGGRVPQ
jgi:hypothetical protein